MKVPYRISVYAKPHGLQKKTKISSKVKEIVNYNSIGHTTKQAVYKWFCELYFFFVSFRALAVKQLIFLKARSISIRYVELDFCE